MLFVGHFCLPLLTVPLTFLLIPDANMKDDLTVVEVRMIEKRQRNA